MNTGTKNKLLTWLVILLVIANAVSIAMFWLNKNQKPPQPKGTPNEFLVKELKLDAAQQQQLDVLVKEHRQAAELLREKVKSAKDNLFELVKQNDATDSVKQAAAAAVSKITEELDILTVNHFQKVRSLCNTDQQIKFDEIIHQVTAMIAQPRPPMGLGGPQGDRPPPPQP